MKVLVTGGHGFIGRATERAINEAGGYCYFFDREQGDIRDSEAVSKAVMGMDVVIHLAGVLGTHELFDAVHEAVSVNVGGTVNVLDACVRHSAKYVGITMPQVFPSIYTATKVCATRLATAYHVAHDLPIVHVRAFNAYGPGQAHGPGHPQKIIPTFAVNAWKGIPIPVWGDGTQSVDLIHVDTLAKILVGAASLQGPYATADVTIDGGSGRSFTVNEVVRAVCKIVGVNPLVQYLPMRRGEVPTEICAMSEGWEFLDGAFAPTVEETHPRRSGIFKLQQVVEAYKDWK